MVRNVYARTARETNTDFLHVPLDKIFATARHGSAAGPVVGFVAGRLININGFGTVFHTGLTAVVPDRQSKGIL